MKLVYNDSSHSYWLDGKRVKSASKVAQIASDSFTIEQWQKRQVAIGMTLDRTLAERVAVDLDNREAIQAVCDDAANTAKANARAQRGTQRHRVFELGLLGRQDQFITDQQIEDWKVLERTLDAYQLEPIPDRVEQFIAWPEHGVVGRYDAYLYHHAVGMPVLVDLKGGENAVKYPHSTAVQEWLYRNAPVTSAAIKRDGDKSEVTEWTTAPNGAAEDFGYVIYCDDHHDIGELWRIDLAAARAGGELALGIVDWRKTKNYGRELAEPIAAPTAPSPVEQPVPAAAAAGTTSDPTYNTRRAQLLERYRSFNDTEKMAYCDLKVDANDLDAIEQALDKVDTFNRVIPPATVDTQPTVEPPTPPDEGGPVADADIAALRRRFNELSDVAQLWISTLTVQGINAGRDWRTNVKPTVRRYELGRAVVRLAAAGPDWGNDDVIRDLLKVPHDDPTPVGDLLSRLDHIAATRFAAAVDAHLTSTAA